MTFGIRVYVGVTERTVFSIFVEIGVTKNHDIFFEELEYLMLIKKRKERVFGRSKLSTKHTASKLAAFLWVILYSSMKNIDPLFFPFACFLSFLFVFSRPMFCLAGWFG